MNKKRLNEENIANELRGGSLFFQKPAEIPAFSSTENSRVSDPVMPQNDPKQERKESNQSPSVIVPATTFRKVGSTQASTEASNRVSTPASVLALYSNDLIDDLRKIVKSTGKEVSFVRLTPEEKRQLVDIVYIYKSQGVKTSETEINRIAVNYMLEDYKANGEASLLAKVMAAILA